MLLATLIFSGWNSLWLVVVGLAGAGILLAWNYRPAPTGGMRILCAGLKLLGFLALALCLLEPLWSGQRARPGANLFAVVADNSQGLQIRDHGASGTRGEALRDLLNPQRRAWLGLIEDEFEVRRYLFDSRLQASKDFSDLTFEGRSSAIGSALRRIRRKRGDIPLCDPRHFFDRQVFAGRLHTRVGREHIGILRIRLDVYAERAVLLFRHSVEQRRHRAKGQQTESLRFV